MRVTSSADSIVPYCVSTTTATSGCRSCTCFNSSTPFLCCSFKSVSTMSTAECSRPSSASSAVATAMAFIPHCSETVAQVSRMDCSSSTMRRFMGTTSRRTAASSLIKGIMKNLRLVAYLHLQFRFRKSHWTYSFINTLDKLVRCWQVPFWDLAPVALPFRSNSGKGLAEDPPAVHFQKQSGLLENLSKSPRDLISSRFQFSRRKLRVTSGGDGPALLPGH